MRQQRKINGIQFIGSKVITNKQYAQKVADVVRASSNRNARVIPNSKGFRIYVGPNKATYNARFKIGPTEIWDISEPNTKIPHPNPSKYFPVKKSDKK